MMSHVILDHSVTIDELNAALMYSGITVTESMPGVYVARKPLPSLVMDRCPHKRANCQGPTGACRCGPCAKRDYYGLPALVRRQAG